MSLADFMLTELYLCSLMEAHIKIRPFSAESQRKVEFLNLYLIVYSIVFDKLALVEFNAGLKGPMITYEIL